MKKISYSLMLAGLVATQAFADPIYIDVSNATTQNPGNTGTATDADTYTSVFSQMQLFADTTTIQFDTNTGGTPGLNAGDRFIDSGTAAVTDLLPPMGDDEGISFLSEITVAWTGLTGITTSDLTPTGPFGDTVQTIAYDTDNAILSFYFHGDGTGPNADFGFDVGVADNTGFTDGEKVLDIKIQGGSGTNTFNSFGDFVSGSSYLIGEITYALQDFWWFDDGNAIPGVGSDISFDDLMGMSLPIVLQTNIDQNTDELVMDFSGAGTDGGEGFGTEMFKVSTTHDGSIDFAVVQQVSAPQTWLLYAVGLLLLPFYRFRRKHK